MTNNKEMRNLIQSAKNSHDPVMTQSDNVMLEEKRREEKRLDKKENISPEQSSEPVNTEYYFMTKSGKWFLPIELYNKHKKAYPNINLVTEYEKIDLWLETNKRSRKTKTGMPAFLTRWLNKASPNQPEDYSSIPVQQIAEEYNRVLSNLTGYNAGNLSPQMLKDIAKRWNGSPNAQNITWWEQLFSAIKNQIQDIEPTYRPGKFKFDRLVGHDFENVMNSL